MIGVAAAQSLAGVLIEGQLGWKRNIVEAPWSAALLAASGLIAALVAWLIVRPGLRRLFCSIQATKDVADAFGVQIAQADAELEAARRQAKSADASLDGFQRDVSVRLDHVKRSSQTLHETADDLSRAVLRITSETTTVAVAADSVFRKVTAVAAVGQDFLATISRIGEHAARSARMGVEAVNLTEMTSATVDELTATTDQIGAMTALIAGIAHQTNLLALNATIEAARAGEQGRGFAVVAGEVKSLAAETAKAVATIADMATTIRGSTERSVDAIRSIAVSIRGLNQTTADIADAVDERVKAAASLADSVGQAASTSGYVPSAIQKIEIVADETAQGAGLLRDIATEIAEQAIAIRHGVDSYVLRVEIATVAPDSFQVLSRDREGVPARGA